MSSVAAAIRGWIDRRPLVVVAAIGLVVVVGHVLWVWANRPANTFNPDEAGYLADALRFERSLLDGLIDPTPSLAPLAEAVENTTTGPLVPLATVPFLALFGRSPIVALVVPALFHLLAAVSVAGIVRRLATPLRAVVAGLVVLALPGAALAARSYLFAGPAAALLAGATWALLASDRGERRGPMLALGGCIGALVLSRTMAVAFLPGLVLAIAVHLTWSARARWHVLGAALVAVVVAAPWWLAAGDRIVDYLVAYGYDSPAADYGAGGLGTRVVQRFGSSLLDVRPLLALPALAWAVASVAGRRRRGEAPPPGRPLAAVWLVVGVGLLVLLTTRNSGIWFELPLVVVGVAAVAGSAPTDLRLRRWLGGAIAVAASANLLLVGNLRVGASWQWDVDGQTASAAMLLFGDMYQPVTATRTADPLLLSDPRDRRAEGDAWYEAHDQLVEVLESWRSERDGLLQLTVTGSSSLMNLNTIRLHQEDTQRPVDGFDAVDSGAADVSPWLAPTVGALPRALVVVRSRQEVFPGDRGWQDVLDAAEADGWERRGRVPLPDGGDALVLVPPS